MRTASVPSASAPRSGWCHLQLPTAPPPHQLRATLRTCVPVPAAQAPLAAGAAWRAGLLLSELPVPCGGAAAAGRRLGPLLPLSHLCGSPGVSFPGSFREAPGSCAARTAHVHPAAAAAKGRARDPCGAAGVPRSLPYLPAHLPSRSCPDRLCLGPCCAAPSSSRSAPQPAPCWASQWRWWGWCWWRSPASCLAGRTTSGAAASQHGGAPPRLHLALLAAGPFPWAAAAAPRLLGRSPARGCCPLAAAAAFTRSPAAPGACSKLGVAVGITQACFNALARTCVRALR